VDDAYLEIVVVGPSQIPEIDRAKKDRDMDALKRLEMPIDVGLVLEFRYESCGRPLANERIAVGK